MGAQKFEFPADFNPQFQKDYTLSGGKFTIQVQERGIIPKEIAGDHAVFFWAFVILVNGNRVLDGPYYWSTEKRRLTLENVSNHLASYWGNSKQIEDAQGLAENNEEALNVLVFKCAEWMHMYFKQDDAFRDFEIVSKFMDENGWEIYLSPNYLPGRILRFTIADDKKYVTVNSYILDRTLKTIL
jgi:hypothetical protein